MVYRTAPFSISLSDSYVFIQGHGVTIDALGVLCAQVTRDLFAIVKYLSRIVVVSVLHIVIRSILLSISCEIRPFCAMKQ